MSEKQPQQPEDQPKDIEEIIELVNGNPWNADALAGEPDEEVGGIYSVEIGPEGQIEDAERLSSRRPMVWIACLAAYNDGTLHGEWVDAAVEDEELAAAAQRVLATSPVPGAEEYAIFDSDEFGAFRVGEYDRLATVARVARGIKEHGHPFSVWAELHAGDEAMLDSFEDAFLGEYDSPSAWAHDVLLDSWLRDALDTVVPEPLRPYIHIDCVGWARDAELSGDVYIEPAPGGRVYVFSTR